MIALDGVSLGYGGPPVLRDLRLAIRPGERVALLGKSGIGKSTLIRHLYGLWPRDAALIAQDGGLVPPLSVFHNIYMGRLDRHRTFGKSCHPGMAARARPPRHRRACRPRRAGGWSCSARSSGFPAGSGSVPRWPARFIAVARCCSPTSRFPRSTSFRPPRSSISSARSSPLSSWRSTKWRCARLDDARDRTAEGRIVFDRPIAASTARRWRRSMRRSA